MNNINQCHTTGLHLTDCDDDGFCNYCGHQDNLMTREEVIEAIVNDDINSIIQDSYHSDYSYINDLLCNGMIGYWNFTKTQLEDEYLCRFDETITVLGKFGS